MRAFFYGIFLQWKLDLRARGILLTYYVVPLFFYLFMGMIFTSINPDSKATLIQSMTVFSITMGAFLGTPSPLVDTYGGIIRKAYQVGGIPLWAPAVNNLISGFLHLLVVSLALFFTAPSLFGAARPENLSSFFLFLILFLLLCLLVGTALGLCVKSPSRLLMLSQLLFLPSILLSGIMFPVSLLPKPLEIAGKFFPASWGMAGMCGGTDWTLWLPALVVAVVAFAICCWRLVRMKGE